MSGDNENFRRSIRLQVLDAKTGEGLMWGDREALGPEDRPLRIDFETKQDDYSTPNEATIDIWNLNEESRAFVSEGNKALRIYAGYKEWDNRPRLLYQGSITKTDTEWSSKDDKTTLKSGDGHSAYTNSKIAKSYSKQQTTKRLIQKTAQKMIEDSVNLTDSLVETSWFGDQVDESKNGFGGYLVGRSSDVMNRLCEAAGASWSVQNGRIEVVGESEPLYTPAEAVLVSKETGMQGIPEKTDRGIKFEKRLDPEISPRRLIQLESEFSDQSGLWMCVSIGHKGSKYGQTFTSTVECEPYRGQ